jgi:hypothetical protein
MQPVPTSDGAGRCGVGCHRAEGGCKDPSSCLGVSQDLVAGLGQSEA